MSGRSPCRLRVSSRSAPGLVLVVAAAMSTVGLYRPPVASASAAQQSPAAMFSSSCAGCHTLAAAEASGRVGPSLDKSTKTVDEIVELITDGPGSGGAMPAFKDQLTTAQIKLIAQYVVRVRGKAKGETAPPESEPEPAVQPGAAASSSVLTLTVAPRPRHPNQLTLVARLHRSAARGAKTIAFFVVSTEFKQPANVPIGTAETGASGTAQLTYTPTWRGEERFVAKLTGSGAHVPAATVAYRVAASAPGPLDAVANPGWPLASVGKVFLDTILAVVAFVWLGLIVTLAVAFGWMPRLAGRGID